MNEENKCLINHCNTEIKKIKSCSIFCKEHYTKFQDFLGRQWIPNATIEKWRKYPKLHENWANERAAEFICQENLKVNPKFTFKKTREHILKTTKNEKNINGITKIEQKKEDEWKEQDTINKRIAKEFKTIKNKWVKNWNFWISENEQLELTLSLNEELNDTYKLRNSYENKNHFCDEEFCRKQWIHFVKCDQIENKIFHLCDYHIKKFNGKMFKILQNVKKEIGNKSMFGD
ncbi:hypothetical protein [Spiroplasma endosymbiont of Colias croceus]|uniref:hypothetical protein n=1 Tax=Spiroplasma endosymbiont of Colias croceus TaxID=3066310 RepID=UPI0030CCB653